MTDASIREALESGAKTMGLGLSGGQRDSLLALIEELDTWNHRFNLTAIRDPRDMVVKHLLDSLSIQRWLHGSSVADVGTGAGFPGLPLAVINPQRRFALIESTTKKARFVQHAAVAIGLDNVQVVNARAEAHTPSTRFDTVVCRAVGKVAEFVRLAGHLCAPDGRMLAMKGQYPETELQGLPRGWRVVAVQRLEVPGLDAERHLVELERG
jgi:16S rRNA (guanine527-N7)-methyltransferase